MINFLEKNKHTLVQFFQGMIISIINLLLVSCTDNPKVVTPTTLVPHTKAKKDTLLAPTIKVYVENSGSMDGYITGQTDFENAVYSYLSDIQLANLGTRDSTSCKNILQLNYINSEILNQPSDVKAFIKNLEPDTFKILGGNRGTSDMSDILDKILKQNGPNDISILISDCIFSPGRTFQANDNADKYLLAQQIGIKNHFAEKLFSDTDFSVVIMQLISGFDGYYYNKFDDKTYIKNTRPFYIWVMGNKAQVKNLMTNVRTDKIKGSGVRHIYTVSAKEFDLNYGILLQRSIGKFNPDRIQPKTTVTNVRKKNGNFQLSVGMDYSKCLLDDEYLINTNNYTVSSKAYTIEIVKNHNPNFAYTHILKLKLAQPVISKGSIKISLLNKMPVWVEKYTDTIGLDINTEGAMEKTYGLKYLIGGVYDACSNDSIYGTININIK